ncbi:MAG: DUF4381 domain-containing protein [Nitrospira sp.]|nr:DUF4381 domain-containing protein [Nitrospira sp.]
MRTTEQALSGLLEISLPPPVPYTPQTVGWVFLGLFLVTAISYGAWRWRRWWASNRYRRAAAAQLRTLEALLADPARRGDALAAIPPLVKQTALSFLPRPEIAGLSNNEWLVFLDRTYPPGGFARGPGRLLPRLAYGAPADLALIPISEVTDLLSLVRRWITHHHARV